MDRLDPKSANTLLCTYFKKMLGLSITFFKDRVPGQIPLLHDSVAFAFPSHGAPPKRASVSLIL